MVADSPPSVCGVCCACCVMLCCNLFLSLLSLSIACHCNPSLFPCAALFFRMMRMLTQLWVQTRTWLHVLVACPLVWCMHRIDVTVTAPACCMQRPMWSGSAALCGELSCLHMGVYQPQHAAGPVPTMQRHAYCSPPGSCSGVCGLCGHSLLWSCMLS